MKNENTADAGLVDQIAGVVMKVVEPVIVKQNEAIGTIGDTVTVLAQEMRERNDLLDRLTKEISGLRESVATSASKLPGYLRQAPEIQDFVSTIDGKIRGLEQVAFHDQLTGITNRAGMDRIFSQSRGNFVAMLIDIDHFKRVNDTFGHATGDEVLRRVAQETKASAQKIWGPERTHVFRVGGEEIAILAGCRRDSRSNNDYDAVAEAGHFLSGADAIRKRISGLQFTSDSGGKFNVTVSIGVASEIISLPSNDKSLSRFGDQLLYAAKNSGRNCVGVDSKALSVSLDKMISDWKKDQGVTQAAGVGGPKPGR